MGKGGQVVLINGTKQRWKKIHSHTYQMNHWDFPELINAGTVQLCYVEWNQGPFKNHKNDKGECRYQLVGSNLTFLIGASAEHGFNIYIEYSNFSNLSSNKFDLAFDHNGFMVFSLSGEDGKYVSSKSNASNWMSENMDLLSQRILKDICLPGSHDSGMSQIHSPTAFANARNAKTQAMEILDQLNAGIRYFDIRPIIGGGGWHTGHYSKVGIGWQGARGQSIDSIIDQLNIFTSRNKELIIISLSHGLNTDLGNSSYRPLNQDEYEQCLDRLSKINNLFKMENEEVNLVEKPLNFFLNGNRSAVICIMNDGIDLKEFYHKGFYTSNEFDIIGEYADSNDLNRMIDDQLIKLAKNRSNAKNYFAILWILTLQDIQNITGLSIEQIAHKANTSIHRLILDSSFRSLVKKGFPNIICQDFVTSDCTSLALAINFFRDDTFHVNFTNIEHNLTDFLRNPVTYYALPKVPNDSKMIEEKRSGVVKWTEILIYILFIVLISTFTLRIGFS